jgi:elongation factor Ts
MTAITASLVNELRKRTDAPMMDCKRALTATGGDIEKAVEELRKSGMAKAEKVAGRVAAEGKIEIAGNDKQACMLEINCQTDFVGRDTNFTAFTAAVAKVALQNKITDVNALVALTMPGETQTIEDARKALITKVGENVQVRRIVLSSDKAACVGSYVHGSRIGVIVELDTDNTALARDIAMHIAASKPVVVTPDQVPADLIAKEKEIYSAQAAASGKPADIIEKMVVGRLKKYLDEVSLVGQPFVKDPDTTVGALLAKNKATVLAFHRFEVGEGIEKIVEDFREAVMAQVQGG